MKNCGEAHRRGIHTLIHGYLLHMKISYALFGTFYKGGVQGLQRSWGLQRSRGPLANAQAVTGPRHCVGEGGGIKRRDRPATCLLGLALRPGRDLRLGPRTTLPGTGTAGTHSSHDFQVRSCLADGATLPEG